MNYLLEYIENRRLTDAPNFKKKILTSFFIKTLLLTIFLPIDIIYLVCTQSTRQHKFDAVIFAEKYKDISQQINGNTALITSPSFSNYFSNKNRVYYMPASIYFFFTLLSLILGKIILTKLHQLNCHLLILQTDGLPVPRFLLKSVGFDRSVCIQHGEFRYLNKVYDGILCDQNIVLGEDQAKLFSDAKFGGQIDYLDENHMLISNRNQKFKSCFDTIVLVGQGYHVNNIQKHRKYLKDLYRVEKMLEGYGFKVLYRPHPSESPWNYLMFIFKTEKGKGKQYFCSSHLYVGSESTLLRKVKENGGKALFINQLTDSTARDLINDFSVSKLANEDVKFDQIFSSYAVRVINECFR